MTNMAENVNLLQVIITALDNAFAVPINKVSGKGTWQSSPWVFVYEFDLID